MKHHFVDELDRSFGHWSICPNRDRWVYHFDDVTEAPSDQRILTITKNDRNWRRVHELSKLEELTLHEPSKEQLQSIEDQHDLLRLRITHARPKSLEFLSGLGALRELVLEYVSGVEDLKPVGSLPKLESLHLENLRRVKHFSGLLPGRSLKYLSIGGTLDWRQPIADLEFLGELADLEFLRLAEVRVLANPPALGGLARLKKMKSVAIAMNALPIEDFAFLEATCPTVDGATRPAFAFNHVKRRRLSDSDHRASLPEPEFLKLEHAGITEYGERYIKEPVSAFLLGKGTPTLSGKPETIIKRCQEHESRYRRLVDDFRASA